MPDQSPLRVLQVLGALSMGGAETWLMELLRFWAKIGGPRMDFLLTGGKRAIFDDEAEKLGARLYYLPYGRTSLAGFAGGFRGILRERRYDAIHDHADYASGLHFLLGAGHLPPVRVSHIHNPWLHIDANYGVSGSRILAAWLGKQLVRGLATHVCGTSADVLYRYGFPPRRHGRPISTVLHCGFDISLFNGPPDQARVSVRREFGWEETAKIVLFAGRLDRALEFEHPQNHKNSWLALNAARAAVERDPSIRFLMAGDGEDQRREMQRHVASWNMAGRLVLTGVRQDMPRLMRSADMLFFPSRQEGLGMAAIEAQAAGLPVLMSDAVPEAARVIPALVHRLPVHAEISDWAEAILQTLRLARIPQEVVRREMEKSQFAIGTSAGKLAAIYGMGRA